MTLTREQIQEIMDGCDILPPGDWDYRELGNAHSAKSYYIGQKYKRDKDKQYEGYFGSVKEERYAQYIARLDPVTVKELCRKALLADELMGDLRK